MIKVMVAVDKSPESNMALRYACQLLQHSGAWLEVLHVRPDEEEMEPDFYSPLFQKDALIKWINKETRRVEKEVLKVCKICSAGQIPCRFRLVSGDPADEILYAADFRGQDLVVLGSQGRSALLGFVLGAVHAKILHHARQSVLFVRGFRPVEKVLVAYRGSKCDQGVLEFTAALLAGKKPEITLLHVQETERGEGDEFAQRCLLRGSQTLKQRDHVPFTKAAKGDFLDEIIGELRRESYDLLVLGAYSGKRQKYLKLISDEVLHLVSLTTCPVLVYRNRNET